MAKKKNFVSLKIKLVITLTVALAVASLVFLGAKEVGDFLVWRYYLDEETKQERAEDYVKDFQNYVTSNKLLTTDSAKINGWSAGGFVEMIFYKDSTLIYAPEWFEKMESEMQESAALSESLSASESESIADSVAESESAGVGTESSSGALEESGDTTEGLTETLTGEESGAIGEETGESGSSTDSGSESESETLPPVENGWLSGDRGFKQYLSEEDRAEYSQRLKDILDGNQKLRPIEFVDGTLFVSVVDYTEDFVYALVFATALILALVVLILIMVVSFTGMASRINRLANKVKLVESGNLDLTIKAEGNDEISALANDINSMRNAVVDNMTKEKKAWETNAELITALSHDVRTPLTVMLGYLDILELQTEDPTDAEYVLACRENAMKLKRLSDDMFSYFTVFGKNALSKESLIPHSAEIVGHMVAEHELLIVENGGSIKYEGELPRVILRLDEIYFSRVIDNIFSNINKYADLSEPIIVRSSLSGETLTLEFVNKIKESDERAESNRIGIKTCMRIVEQLGGSFITQSDESVFTVHIELPTFKD